jgi:hypothetical protein
VSEQRCLQGSAYGDKHFNNKDLKVLAVTHVSQTRPSIRLCEVWPANKIFPALLTVRLFVESDACQDNGYLVSVGDGRISTLTKIEYLSEIKTFRCTQGN